MILFCLTLKFDSGDTSITHLGFESEDELRKYLNDQQQDFWESGIVEYNYFKVTKTDNNYNVILQ